MPSAPRPILERHIQPAVEEALTDTRVVVVLGARQVGKSTLVEAIARDSIDAAILTFDDQATRAGATADPTGFVADLATPVVIDEAQRVPDVLLAIKQRVDREPAPGQFLLTGSANILTAPQIADALTGRAEYLHLRPFSQGELAGKRETFIPTLFDGAFPQLTNQPIGRRAYAAAIAAGGYPETIARTAHRRARFFDSYLDTVIQRDLASIAKVADRANVRRLLDALAAVSACVTNFQALSRTLGIANNTLRGYTDLLETLFLIQRIAPWSSNLQHRTLKTPKAHITDTGLLSHLIGANQSRIEGDSQLAGMFFETFAAMELLRQSEWDEHRPRLHHYRDKEKREVDILLERREGTVIGIEVKTAASAERSDFRGLAYLREKLGDRFRAGALLYTGPNTIPFGDRLAAVPLAGLWA
jgi:predicted AAA+ superfamily ATPase